MHLHIKNLINSIPFGIFIICLVLFSGLTSNWLAAPVAMIGVLAYCIPFFKVVGHIIRGKYPYGYFRVLFAACVVITFTLARIFARSHIATITGFSPTIFLATDIASYIYFVMLSTVVTFLILFSILVTVQFLELGLRLSRRLTSNPQQYSHGYDYNIQPHSDPLELLKMATIEIRLALTMCMVILSIMLSNVFNYISALNHSVMPLDILEDILLSVDFVPNSQFQEGLYMPDDSHVYEYGIQLCRNLPRSAFISPDSDGNIVVAEKRLMARKLDDYKLDSIDLLITKFRYYKTECQDKGNFHQDLENK